jgi:CBS domain-containing protein
MMRCTSCGYDNIPGADHCEECHASLMHEDVPLARINSAIERSLSEDKVDALHPVEAVSVPEDTPLDVAVRTMREREIGCLLVTDRKGKLCGIFTERDLLYKVAGKMEGLASNPVSNYMTPNPEVVRGDQLLASALQRMMVGGLRHLPLVDQEGHPEKILSSRDIINYVALVVEGIMEQK